MSTKTLTKPRSARRTNGSARREPVRPQVNGFSPHSKRKSQSTSRRRKPLLPAYHSEETHELLLRNGAAKRGDGLTVAYHSATVDFDLTGLGTKWLAGAFESELVVDGVPIVPRGEWNSACWHGDEEGEYLELQLLLNDQVRIDRILLLSRREHFALFADAVVAEGASRVEYRIRLPTASGITTKFDSSTREGRLRAGKNIARVFPLALPQDRVLSTSGSILEREGRLEIAQVGAGRGIFVPLVIDWNPKRRGAQADWRSLTVTEPGLVVGSDRAAGQRLRIGKHQLLVYRSLDESKEARAVLGQHMRCETLVGTFDSTGDVTPIIFVETE